jgi:hypothetical protein
MATSHRQQGEERDTYHDDFSRGHIPPTVAGISANRLYGFTQLNLHHSGAKP